MRISAALTYTTVTSTVAGSHCHQCSLTGTCCPLSEEQKPLSGVQVKQKYSAMLVGLFEETFRYLPLAHVLNGRVLVVHGGLFAQDGVKLDDIRAIDRNRCGPAGPRAVLAST